MSTFNPLPLLSPHLPTLLISTIFFYCIQIASHKITPKIFKKYEEFDKRTKIGWASHTVSMVHAILVIPLSIKCLSSTLLKEDPIFGYDSFVGHVFAFSSGYFLWDTLDSIFNSTIGFVIHGAACLAVFIFSFRPFLAGFGAPFLLWELSTPLLNIHWFMDKAGLSTKYPTFFLINALMFMLTFFLARIVYGGANSLIFFKTMWIERNRIPLHLHIIYCSGNLALNALNWLWFSKMLQKMLLRLQGDKKPIKPILQVKKGEGEKEPLLEKSNDNNAINEEEEEEEGSLTLPANPPSPIIEKRDHEEL
ncbi:uncharacterized protein I206_101872 [Kwoniella pini CBS 10737]|uniref:TLC domain-containing protein n=1 Tax=Kwoniella pini CBS 10737 TaxID=1296096 RepID=A0A1B9HVH6_9TREE|nr:uncharacterized protein I206_07037 [Kwoniella pini CBS 10737]OCF47259.1 hypothetical protein I206_07037 [Kwoniella pini CBS 10737]